MGAMIGMVIGYVLGTRAGERGFEELKDAWQTITTSEEVKDMVVGGVSLLGDLARQGRDLLAERLQSSAPVERITRAA
jgi:hypothetical protein